MKQWKSIFIMIALLLVSCESDQSPTQTTMPTPTCGVKNNEFSVTLGNRVAIPVYYEGLEESISGISGQISYPSRLVTFAGSTGLVAGDEFDADALVFGRCGNNVIYFSLSQLNGKTVNQLSGMLFTLYLTGVQSGSDSLTFNQNQLRFYNPDGGLITIPEIAVNSCIVKVQ